MEKRIKAKVVTTIICLLLSVVALYTFIFIIDVTNGWRVILIGTAISWIISGVINLAEYFKMKK